MSPNDYTDRPPMVKARRQHAKRPAEWATDRELGAWDVDYGDPEHPLTLGGQGRPAPEPCNLELKRLAVGLVLIALVALGVAALSQSGPEAVQAETAEIGGER